MTKLKLSRVLLVAAILLIVAFQSYWLNRLYKEEWLALKKETNGIFRDVVYKLQVDRFKQDTLFYKQTNGKNLFVYNAVNALRIQNAERTKNSGNKNADNTKGVAVAKGFVINEHDTNYSSKPGRVEIHRGNLPPELAQLLAARQNTKVGLPPMIDTEILKRMSQSGMNVVVKISNHANDTSISLERNPSVSLLSDHTPRFTVRTTTTPFEKKNTMRVDVNSMDVKGGMLPADRAFVRMITDGKVLDDTLPILKLDSAYKKELAKAGMPVSFSIKKGKDDSLHLKDTINSMQFTTSPASVGLLNPYWYQAAFENPTTYLLKKISLQILFSLFLIAFTSVTFIFLYRNLLAQRKLTEMKNDFISNITHELKTPLATVSVAVEALRSFGGIQNPERTKEYLDISAAELQRLSLLVDKVLKLSLFENRELELKKEIFDLKQLTEEVLNTMKLQFDAHRAKVDLAMQGQYFTINADRLHITSVIFNLLDNALKYSKENPEIHIRLQHVTDTIILQVEDRGIGISTDFKAKIFDKFFRVPTGNHHNIKGYGLGLSYVAHVVKRHGGIISVDSEPGIGSTFTVKFPIT